MQCSVTGETDVALAWSKNGQSLSTSQESRESRFSVEKKASEVRQNETIVQLEILDASVEDKGSYELEATAPATGAYILPPFLIFISLKFLCVVGTRNFMQLNQENNSVFINLVRL